MKLKLTMVAAALSSALTGGGAAAATIFTDHAAWLAAVTGVSTYGFEGVPDGQDNFLGTTTFTGPGFALDPQGTTDNSTVDPAYSGSYNWNTGDVYTFFSLGGEAKINISAGENFGFFFGAPAPVFPTTITIGSTVYSNLPARPSFLFFGVTGWKGGDLPMISSNPNFNLTVIDNFSVARGVTSSVIPEPSTWMLMILGFGLIARQLRRRHQTAVAV